MMDNGLSESVTDGMLSNVTKVLDVSPAESGDGFPHGKSGIRPVYRLIRSFPDIEGGD